MSREKSTDRLLTVAIGFVVSGFPSFRKLGNWWKQAKTRILFWHFGQVVPTTVARECTVYFRKSKSVFDFLRVRLSIYYYFCLQLTAFHLFPTIPKPIEYYVRWPGSPRQVHGLFFGNQNQISKSSSKFSRQFKPDALFFLPVPWVHDFPGLSTLVLGLP
jgi:hypothetical protein